MPTQRRNLTTVPRLFSRLYEVAIGTPSRPAQAIYGNAGKGAALRVAFSIQKTAKSAPNKATVTITNMAAKNRASLTKGMLCTLSVGYVGTVQTLFVGVVTKVSTARKGSDIETEMELGDGESAITQTFFHRSYDTGATLSQVLTDISEAMGLVTAANPTGLAAGTSVGIPEVTYGNGLALEGGCKTLLDTLCRPFDLEWSVQNGALQVIPVGKHTGEEAEILSSKTGLLEVPSLNGHMASFTALLNPRLVPGRLVVLESRTVNGTFKVRTANFEGDSHGDKWQVAVEAVEMVQRGGQALPAVGASNFASTEEMA